MGELYSLSDDLKEEVLAKARTVENKLYGLVKFEEYIVLPDFGEKVIIRFKLMEDNFESLEELDEIERSIRNILGIDYWGNLLGKSYEKFGFRGDRMLDSLINISLNVDDKVIHYNDTSYCQYIKKDKELIKNLVNLSSQQKIWEIQILNEEDIRALILVVDEGIESEGPYEKLFEKDLIIEGEKVKAICYKNSKSFNGIIKAYFTAEQNNISLMHMILKYQKV